MPYLVEYLLKLSVAITVIYLFYAIVLQRLTFYNWNRWYLLGYSVLAFLIPFIDISDLIRQLGWESNRVVQVIPALGNYTGHTTVQLIAGTTYNPWDISLAAFTIVAVLLFMRLLMKYFSYLVMRRSARMLLNDPVNVYQVNMNIIPFSFGKSIYINRAMHSEEELKKIIEHEFVHIKQRHSADIIWAEIFCILNWYNPFAWLIRKAIRQNLEFIADNCVLETGIDRKQYQYLLLKVTGNTSYSMGNNFNFSSLTKRIFMMNKAKSTTIHLAKFLFILPLAAVMILAFRSNHIYNEPANIKVLSDTVPALTAKPAIMAEQVVKPNPKMKPAPEPVEAATDSSFFIDASLEGPGNPYTMGRLISRIDSAAPLLIVNGKEYPLSINTLDPIQIESINILKDKSAIEKYGERAKNGVIEILTKQELFITISWQKISFNTKTVSDGHHMTVRKEFVDSLNRLREEKGLLYLGIYNIADVKVKDTKPENVIVQVDNATVIRENSTFTISTKSPGKTVLRIYATDEKGDKKEIYQQEITVVYLPSPRNTDIIIDN